MVAYAAKVDWHSGRANFLGLACGRLDANARLWGPGEVYEPASVVPSDTDQFEGLVVREPVIDEFDQGVADLDLDRGSGRPRNGQGAEPAS